MGRKDTKEGLQLALLTPSASAIVKIDMHRGSAHHERTRRLLLLVHPQCTLLHALPFFSPPSFHTISVSPAFTSA
jgi:hypothetical protein